MRPLKKAIFAGALLATSSFSHAGLIGVQHVVITSALAAMGNSEGYIQVGEFEAFETGSGINAAHQANGGSASSLSFWGGYPPMQAIDGDFSNMFHSLGNTTSEFLRVDFSAITELSSINIKGRSTGFNHRDLFNIEFFDASGGSLYQVLNVDARNGSTTFGLPNTKTDPGSVPVPATAALFLLGFAGVTASQSRKTKKA